ncbi:hypothetical protein cypCar_00048656, partial [Cyprinus carpio]
MIRSFLQEALGGPDRRLSFETFTDSREAVAVKVVSKKSLNKSSMENLLTEIEILKTVRHPHIVQLKDFQYMSPWDEQQALRGSPLYMAPEIVCRRYYDARVDLWAEALFGRAPFASRSFAELEEKIRSEKPIE